MSNTGDANLRWAVKAFAWFSAFVIGGGLLVIGILQVVEFCQQQRFWFWLVIGIFAAIGISVGTYNLFFKNGSCPGCGLLHERFGVLSAPGGCDVRRKQKTRVSVYDVPKDNPLGLAAFDQGIFYLDIAPLALVNTYITLVGR